MDNDWKKRLGVVYSTNPEYQYDSGEEEAEETPPPEAQRLIVKLDKKHRKGKTITLVEGFRGSNEELKALGRDLKSRCGVGGSAKEGEILVQGDFRDRLVAILTEMGYNARRSGG